MYIYLKDLALAARSSGLDVVELSGWTTAGRPARTGASGPYRGVSVHHTGSSSKAADLAYAYSLQRGRSDLPGPLCHLGLSRNGTVYVIAAGRTNHGGKVKAGVGPFVGSDLNHQSIGIEAFNSGYEGWTTKQLSAYHKLCAALCDWYKIPRANVFAHAETSTTGKWDPGVNGRVINMKTFRAAVKAVVLPSKGKGKDYGALDPRSYRAGYRNASTLWLKGRVALHLAALGTKHNMNLKTKLYGRATVKAVKAFQKAQGWTGADADGLPGRVTLERLSKAPVAPAGGRVRLDVRHASMQFSDTRAQQQSDVTKLFSLRAVDVFTGTEAVGTTPLAAMIKKAAVDKGFHAYVGPNGTDAWIAIRKSIVKKVVSKSFKEIIPSSGQLKGTNTKFSKKGLVRMEVVLKDGGTLVVYALHGLVRSRTKKQSIKLGAKISYQDQNRKLVKALEKAMVADYKAGKVAIYGGDFNQLFQGNKTNGALFDTSLTSAWKAKKYYPNTGHGCIDGIGFLARDKRIKVESASVWTDVNFALFTDHFLIGSVLTIKPSKKG